MQTANNFQSYGLNMPVNLTAQDILMCRKSLNDIIIAPFDDSKCKGIGYNLSPSELCYSVRKRHLLQIHRTPQEVYVLIPPHDTILTLSYEYLQVSAEIAGCFLSRLRPVTKGLGNISTTLDPCWKGMLLLSINNPTNRAIKLVISQLKDDKFTPVAVTTMVLWRVASQQGGDRGTLTLNLDNPAMRTDIWAELSAEPYLLFRGKQYQQFRELIQLLSDYKPSPNLSHDIIRLQLQMERLENAVRASPREYNVIQEVLLFLFRFKSDQAPPELIRKINTLLERPATPGDNFEHFNTSLGNIICNLSTSDEEQAKEYSNKFLEDINLIYQECEYQKLCSQVAEIHGIIRKKTQYIWRLDMFKRFWHNKVRPHLSGILASAVIAVLLLYGEQAPSPSFSANAIISVLPALISFLLDRKH